MAKEIKFMSMRAYPIKTKTLIKVGNCSFGFANDFLFQLLESQQCNYANDNGTGFVEVSSEQLKEMRKDFKDGREMENVEDVVEAEDALNQIEKDIKKYGQDDCILYTIF